MIPFCRTVDEARRVIEAIAANGLKQGEDGLEVYAMFELPSNVVSADEFLKVFDGYSKGGRAIKILIAVDGSECSDVAVEEVAKRPWPAGSALRIISVAETLPLEALSLKPRYREDVERACGIGLRQSSSAR